MYVSVPACHRDVLILIQIAKLTLGHVSQYVSQQNTVVALLNNINDSRNITGLVEDMKDVIIEYQVTFSTPYDSVVNLLTAKNYKISRKMRYRGDDEKDHLKILPGRI